MRHSLVKYLTLIHFHQESPFYTPTFINESTSPSRSLGTYHFSDLMIWNAESINKESLRCKFGGRMRPIITWRKTDGEEIETGSGSPYRVSYGSDPKSSTLSIDPTLYSAVQTITCTVTFDGISEYLETSTAVHFRGRQLESRSSGTIS